jgi:HK97 family phage prohead protease/HK97 family phage major capsid protein
MLHRYSEDEPRDESGKWTSGGGSGAGGDADKPGAGKVAATKQKIKDFINGPGKAAVHAVGVKLKENQKELLASAITVGLYHVVGLDFPPEVESAIHNEVTNFATNAQISVAAARDYIQKAVNALVAMRKKAVEDDDVLDALLKLKKHLDNDELFKDDDKKSHEVRPMPLPKPRKGESQDDFIGRCMHEAFGDDAPADRTQEQAVAMCMQAWRDKEKQYDDFDDDVDVPEPDDEEGHSDFMDRCVDELANGDAMMDEDEATDACQMAWENRGAKDVTRKTHSDEVHGMEFILSDESVDRIGDSISSDGWSIEAFKRNPIALWQHRPDLPIGTWEHVRVQDKALRGRLKLAPKGASARIDEIRSLIEAGILRAVSVGFRDLESEPLDKNNKGPWGPKRFLKQELIECSLVSIPANANALAVAKSLKISPQTLDLVFAKHGNKGDVKRRGFVGKHAETPPRGKGTAMSLSQRITSLETQLVDTRDMLQEHLEKMDDTNVSDADLQKTNDLNSTIAQLERTRNALVDSEKALGKTVDDGHVRGANGAGSGSRALALFNGNASTSTAFTPARAREDKKLGAIDYLVRAGTVALQAKNAGRMPAEMRQRIYGEDEMTAQACDLILRAASAPALTTVTGWAAELVHQIYTDFMQLLLPKTLLPSLAARGMALSFGQAGRIIIPTRNRTPTVAGSFVGEGMAIPVRQGAFSSQTLTPKKVAVITSFTREMSDHSIPAIEGLLREAIQLDTSIAIDTVLIDSNAATTIRPAGLLNGITPITPTAGGGLTALTTDLKLLIQALITGTYGNVRSPVWLTSPGDMLAAGLTSAANTGIFPFRDEIARGTLGGIPFIESVTVAAHTMILIDAADFVVVGGEAPRIEISDQATLHMEDTAPTDLVAGSPGVVASPQRSLFQTDSLALRLVMPLNWLQRRAGTIVSMTGTTWS